MNGADLLFKSMVLAELLHWLILSSAHIFLTPMEMSSRNGIHCSVRENEYRMSPYHRVDLSLARVRPTNEGGEKHLIFSVHNVYNNLNPFFAQYNFNKWNAAVVEYGLFSNSVNCLAL